MPHSPLKPKHSKEEYLYFDHHNYIRSPQRENMNHTLNQFICILQCQVATMMNCHNPTRHHYPRLPNKNNAQSSAYFMNPKTQYPSRNISTYTATTSPRDHTGNLQLDKSNRSPGVFKNLAKFLMNPRHHTHISSTMSMTNA